MLATVTLFTGATEPCALPDGYSDFTLIVRDGAAIAAKNVYTAIAIGGDLVGWPGSTFAQGLAALLDARSEPWYAACPLGEACFDPARAGATPTSLDAKTCTTRTAAAEVLSRRTDGGSDDKLCVANRSWTCGGGGTPASDADLVRAAKAMSPALLPVGIQVRKST
jgi:hypothetical protein